MGSNQLITVPDYNWITITSNKQPPWVTIPQTTPLGLLKVITVRD